MKILVLNCGSSSIKYQLFNMKSTQILAKGVVEKVGMRGSFLKNERSDGDKVKLEGEILDHQAGIEYVLGVLISENHGSLKDLDEIDAIGHRVVHGGEKFKTSVFISDEVIQTLEENIDLAPLHNPPNLKGIYAMQVLLPGVPQVGVFDTAFHQSMPEHAYMYAIPYTIYTKYGIRRYGFHGTSHKYVANKSCEILNVDIKKQRMITCHLGNGASITAINKGKSIDTSMGLTPVEGLIMGTRSGDLDSGILTFIMEKEEIGIESTTTLINKHSGMLGITGVSSDMREIEKVAKEGNKRARLALKMYTYRIKKYIGGYIAAMGGLDILVFTGGIGENASSIRKDICSNLKYLGLELDQKKNMEAGENKLISKQNSNVSIMVVTTNEELVIAEDTERIIESIQISKK